MLFCLTITTYEHSPEPIIEVDALVDGATDFRVSRIEPPALVVLGRDVGGDGLALAQGKVTLLKYLILIISNFIELIILLFLP